jgi:arylsulfatase A-like enzyme
VYLDQFHRNIDVHLSPAAFSSRNFMVGDKLVNDPISRYQAFEFFNTAHPPASLLAGTANRLLARLAGNTGTDIAPFDNKFYYTMGDVFKGLTSLLSELPQPFFAYLHFYPPHAPYTPAAEFADLFREGWVPPVRQQHPLGERSTNPAQTEARRTYDCFVANLDWEFGRFLEAFKATPASRESCIVVTSDHGEMFERGVIGHESPLLNEPAIHTPLIISMPGDTGRRDFHTPTISVDVMPTLLSLAGQPASEWSEGLLLPGFGGVEDPQRTTYTFLSKGSPARGLLHPATMVLRRGTLKMIYYTGYTGYKGYRNDPRYDKGAFEMYDLADDPEERRDLAEADAGVVGEMKEALLTKYHEASRPLSG